MKLLSISAAIALSVLALAGAQAAEPSFQKLDLGKSQARAKPLGAEPASAPNQTVLTASVQPDGSLRTQCNVETHAAKSRQIHPEHKR